MLPAPRSVPFVRLGSADLKSYFSMASPFRIFRKYLKPLMVVLGVMIMFSFVILDPLAKYLAGGRVGNGDDPNRDANAVAVSWEGGELTNQELDSLVFRRRVARGFLDQVEGLGAQSAYLAGLEPSPLRVFPLRLAESSQQGVEQSVLQTKLYADAAREAGMHVDDDAIVQYLLLLGRDRVTTDDMRAMLQNLEVAGRKVPTDYVFDVLRDELLARNYLMSNMYAFQTVTPQQRWQDWLRVNDRVVLEAAATPVESYLIEVKEPTDAELAEFFEEHKKYEPQPDPAMARSFGVELPMPVKGFRVPRKIDVQYLQANFADMVNKAEGDVTDEEIAKYYDDNKELFIKADTRLLDDATGSQDATKADDSAAEEAETTEAPAEPGETKAEETAEPGAATEESGETKAATEGEGAPAPATEEATPPETPSDESQPAPPAETETPAVDGGEEAPPADADQSSLEGSTNRSVFRQAAFLQDANSEGSEEKATTDDPASPTPATEETPAAEPTPTEDGTQATEETPPAEGTPAVEEPPAAEPTPSPEAPAPSEATDVPAGEAATPPADEKPKEYQPLDEVRDLIRRDLAYRRVTENVSKQMDGVLGELTSEFNTYLGQLSEAQAEDQKGPPPVPQDALANLAPIAEKQGLATGKTGALPFLEFRETPVGKSGDPNTGRPLAGMLFGGQDLEHYQPVLTMDIDGNRYIAMKTSDTPGRIPELKEVKDEVVRAWKLKKAAEIALKDAEKQAKAAQEAGSSLTNFYAGKPGVEVIQVDPFSQLTRGDVPDQFGNQRFRLSQPDGIVAAGPELLRRAFALKDGEVAAVLNHDHSIAYVIRAVEHQDSQDELRNAYLAEANTWDGLPAMTDGHITLAKQSVNADLSGGEGVDWKRTPDRTEPDENEAE